MMGYWLSSSDRGAHAHRPLLLRPPKVPDKAPARAPSRALPYTVQGQE